MRQYDALQNFLNRVVFCCENEFWPLLMSSSLNNTGKVSGSILKFFSSIPKAVSMSAMQAFTVLSWAWLYWLPVHSILRSMVWYQSIKKWIDCAWHILHIVLYMLYISIFTLVRDVTLHMIVLNNTHDVYGHPTDESCHVGGTAWIVTRFRNT